MTPDVEKVIGINTKIRYAQNLIIETDLTKKIKG
jgi:hypothetical protein